MNIKILLLSSLLLLIFNYNNDESDKQDASMASMYSKDMPEQEISEAEKQKLLEATGKDVEALSFMEFQNLIKSNDKDKLYIYNFWATWCKPCVEEIPHFESLAMTYPEKVKVIFVSLDNPAKIQEKVQPFVKEKGITSEVILLKNFGDEQIAAINKDWDGAIPASLFVNHQKGVNDFRQQSFTAEELKTALTPYLVMID